MAVDPDELPDLRAGVYTHYKGHPYLVLGYAGDATNGSDRMMVVYVGLSTDGTPSPLRMRVREVNEFMGFVDARTGEPSSVGIRRFTYVAPRLEVDHG